MTSVPLSLPHRSEGLLRAKPVRVPDPRLAGLKHMLQARFSVICVPTFEEDRALNVLATLARRRGRQGGSEGQLQRWSATTGLQPYRPVEQGRGGRDEGTLSPDDALQRVLSAPANGETVYVFCDLHPYLENPQIQRRVRDCARALRATTNTLVLLQPRGTLPGDLEKDVAIADFPLPALPDMESLVAQHYGSFQQTAGDRTAALSAGQLVRIGRACLGLTETEAEDALAKAVIEAHGDVDGMIDAIHRFKQEAIKRTRCLEAITQTVDLGQVGGLDYLKTWVAKRGRCFLPEAAAFGIAPPRGLLALGVPGGGKSLAARAVAHTYQLPLFRLDFGAIFGGIVGESESNVRAALKIVDAIAPCVLWVDEIEKGLAGVSSSDKSDGGTAARVFGTFLTWLQERQAPVFCYFTANRIAGLPPELLRKGRIDEIFFIDLPTTAERAEILAIHLAKRGRDPNTFDLPALAHAATDFVGAELETAVGEALIDAFSAGDTIVTTAHLAGAIARTVPMAKTQQEAYQTLLQFVQDGRAVRASTAREMPALAPDGEPDLGV